MPPGRAPRSARGDARPRRRIRLDNDQRRAQLLALARRAFSDRSYDEVSIDDLARIANISKGLLYHYFPTKRDLYVAGLREIADELVDAVTHAAEDLPPVDRRSPIAGSEDPDGLAGGAGGSVPRAIDQLRASVDAYLEHIARHSRAFVALMRGGIGSDPEVAAVIDSVRTRVFDQLLSGASLANLQVGDPRLETAVRGWIGFVEAASIEWCANPRLTRAELCELVTAVLFEVLRIAAPAVGEPWG